VRSVAVIMVVSCLQLAYGFAPGSTMPLAQSRGHSMSLRPTMALQAAPSAAVLLKTAPAVVQASILVADIFDDIGTTNIIYGGLAVTVVSIAAMLVVLYQDGVR